MKRLVEGLRHPREHEWRKLRPWRQHSQVLIVSGLVYIAVGYTYAATEPSDSRVASLVLAEVIMPIAAWGVLWLIAGTLVVISARWPPVSEKWGYGVLTLLSSWWSFVYVAGVLFLGAPASALSSALLWSLVGYLWYAISGLTNPVVIVATKYDPPSSGEVVSGE
jgi:magnesium-transporting ATPase (P-type)